VPKQYALEAQVHKKYGNGYRVKVSLLELGLYINGMMVYPPDDDHKEWSVLTPARPAGRGKYARIVEFNKKLQLWSEVYEACVDAVRLDMSYGEDAVVTDSVDGLGEEPISLDDIQF
jgi:hypothetical protein